MKRHSWLVLAAALVPALAQAGRAQTVTDSLLRRPLAPRDALTSLAAALERLPADSTLAACVRARLRNGDFRPGDLVLLRVQGESTLTDTFAVAPDTALHLPSPTTGALPLRGVLRAELEPQVKTYLDHFLRHPVVRAQPLVRLSVQGGVPRGGFYGVPVDAPLSDALMAAGGTTPDAQPGKMRLERDGHTILGGRALQHAIAAGTTVDAADLQSGDEFFIPRDRGAGIMGGLNLVWLLVSLAGGIFTLSRVF